MFADASLLELISILKLGHQLYWSLVSWKLRLPEFLSTGELVFLSNTQQYWWTVPLSVCLYSSMFLILFGASEYSLKSMDV